MSFSFAYSTLTLYDGNIGSSPSLELTRSDSSLADNDWDNKASSAVVSGGCQWILYDVAGFADTFFGSSVISPSVISPGRYLYSTILLSLTFPPLDYQTIYSLLYAVYQQRELQQLLSLDIVFILLKCKLLTPLTQILHSLTLTTEYHPLSSLVVLGSCTLGQTTLALWSHADKVTTQLHSF